MKMQSFNTCCDSISKSNRDVLNEFKLNADKNNNIREGMSVNEISDLVSEKIVIVVKEQFNCIKEKQLHLK